MVLDPSEKLYNLRGSILEDLSNVGIETRQGFVPFNLQNIFIKEKLTNPEDCPVAASTASASFYIPSGPDISKDELDYVVSQFSLILDKYLN